MRKIIYYAVLMIIIIILLPLLIVKGCSRPAEKIPAPSEKPEELKISVYISSEDRVEEMLLEEYIRGVVAGEMPAEFELEALKAQAVAARTYAYGRMTGKYVPKDNPHQDADICTDPTHCQAWMSRQAGMEKWGIFNTAKYWGRIEKAVSETENTIIVYENQVINPVFHSNSGGEDRKCGRCMDRKRRSVFKERIQQRRGRVPGI
jgi:stage II sporulation protein D